MIAAAKTPTCQKNRDTTTKLHPGFISRRTSFSGLFQLIESGSLSKDDSQILSFNKKANL